MCLWLAQHNVLKAFKYPCNENFWMTGEDLFEALRNKRDIMVVCSDEPVFTGENQLRVYLIEVESTRGVAGGRAAGYGSRRVMCISGYTFSNGVAQKFFETRDDDRINLFELPYHSTALDVVLPDGTKTVVRGVVDSDLIGAYDALTQ